MDPVVLRLVHVQQRVKCVFPHAQEVVDENIRVGLSVDVLPEIY